MIRRWTALALFAIAAALIAAHLILLTPSGLYGTDTRTYLAAGERLNAGHGLYELVPGDRPVDLNPGYWTTPLVSPPSIAALWRPLAALPSELGAYLWWLASAASLVATLVMLLRRLPLLTGAAMIVLALPTAFQIAAGNINSVLLLGLVLVWRAWVQERDLGAGAMSGVMAAVKLTPAVMVWWLLATGRRRAFAGALASFAAIWLIALVGAGVQAHLDYIAMLRDPTSMGVYLYSLAGIAASWGVPEELARQLPWGAAAIGLVAVWMLRERPAWSFAAAILTMVYGSPTVTSTWYILFYAVLAPAAYPATTEGTDLDTAMISAGKRLLTRLRRHHVVPHPQVD